MTIKAGDTVVNASGIYMVLIDQATNKLRLINLRGGFIYNYTDKFPEEYLEETYHSEHFNLCDLLVKIGF